MIVSLGETAATDGRLARVTARMVMEGFDTWLIETLRGAQMTEIGVSLLKSPSGQGTGLPPKTSADEC